MATTAVTLIVGFGAAAHAATPIDTAQPFYNQSDVGTTVNPDFQGGTLRDNVNAATDTHAYNVENFPTNTLDEFGNTVTFTGTFSGAGPLTLTDSVGGGNAIFTGTSVLGGAVTVDTGAKLTWGNGTGGAFLIGPGNAVVDNGSLVMDFGGASGVVGSVPISGTGSLTVHSGLFEELGPATYTGGTTIDAAGTLTLGNGGSSVGTVVGAITDNGALKFDYAGAGPVTSANAISGSGSAEAVSGTTVITGASAIGGKVTIDSGATMQWGAGGPGFLVGGGNAVVDNGALTMNFGGGGIGGPIPISGSGTVEVQSGSLSDSGASTYTGATTIDAAGFLNLTGAGSIASSADVIANGTLDISGTAAGTSITTLDGAGVVSLGAQTLTLTNASGTFSGDLADGGVSGGVGGGLTIAAGTETLTGTNSFTGNTTIDLGATLALGDGVSNGTVAGNIVDNGLVQFNYNGAATIPGAFSGSGSAEAVAGTTVITGASAIGGTVTIDSGATMQWGAGGPGFLVGGGNAVVDNGALVLNFGGGGIAGAVPISGSGTVEIQSGSLNDSGASTYTGATTIDAAGVLALTAAGSIAKSVDVIDSGSFDISGTTAGASITTLEGAGGVSLGAQTLTLTNASGTFSGVLADGGLFGGTGGGLTIAGGTETLTGTNTYTGATTIALGATLQLGNGGTTGTVAGAVVDNGLVQFDYSGSVVTPNGFSGTGSVEEVAGTVVVTGTGFVGGNVTIDPGATMQWGNGGPAFLVGAGNSVVDNGALTMNFGGGGIAGSIPISGSGTVELQSGSLNDSGASTYTGTTTIDALGVLALTGAGSIANSVDVIDSGSFDISGTTAGASIVALTGAGGVSLGAQTLTLTNAAGTFSGVIADGGLFGGTGGALTIAGGTETLTGANTYTGATTIDLGATLKLGNGGTTGTVAGAVVDNGLVQFDYSGSVVTPNSFSGTGSVEEVAGTVVVTGTSFVGGNVTIDPGATMQWGNGGPAFLVGAGNSVVDNGALTMNFGGGGIAGAIPIAGSGTVEIQSGSLNDSGASTYTGTTTIDAPGVLALTAAGSIANSADVIDSGIFDISGTTAGASITTLEGAGGVSLGAQTLTLTNASGTFSGVLADGGLFGGTGGKLTVAAGTEALSGVNTFTGATTIDLGATLNLVGVGSIADSGDPLVNGTFDISGVSGGGTSVVGLSGSGHVILGSNTLTLSNAADIFSGEISGTGGLTLAGGIEILTGVNTFTGTTLIDTGATLELGNGAGVGLLAGPITDNGLLLFDGGAGSDAIFATAIAGSGALTLENGTLGLTGTNTYTGLTTVGVGATLQLGEGGTTGTVAGSIADNGLVQFNYSGSVTTPNLFFGTGSAEVVAGTVVVTNAGELGGTVTIDNGATMQWGAGAPGFLAGGGDALVDNGALVMDFGGGGGIAGSIPISGTGSVTLQSGVFGDSGASTYTGVTTIDATGIFRLSGTGSIADSSNVIDNGRFDISGTTAGASIITLAGAGGVSLGGQTLTLTNASGIFSGVLADGGAFGGTGGGLTIAAGTETLTGTNTYTGATAIDLGATLKLGAGGATGTVAGAVVDNGLVQFDYSGAVTTPNTFSGGGSAEVVAGTLVVTGASVLGGTVTIDNGATMQWGAGGPGFLLGGGNAVVDNGALTMNFGGGGIAGSIPISGTGTVELQSGAFSDSGASTYTGVTTIDLGSAFRLTGTGSIADSSNVIDSGQFDIFGTTAGASITTLAGAGGVSLGAQTLTLTNATGTFSGVIADGALGGTGGGLTIAAGTETLTGTNTFTGATTIDLGATLKLGNGGKTGTVAGAIVDNGLVQFDYSGSATLPGAFSGAGSAEVVAGTLVVTGAGALGGTVTIDTGATMQWGAGGPGFLVGGGEAVVDNGALVMKFGGGGVAGAIPISGTGTVDVQSGEFSDSGVSTYTGVTTIDAAGTLALAGTGSIADSANLVDNGKFDISGTSGGASIISLSGSGGVSLGAQTLTLTNASGTFSGVLADGGISGGTGGRFTIAAGTETLSGVNTYTGLTTIDLGATLKLSGVGSIADSGDPLVNGTFDISGVSGGGTSVVSLSGSGQVILGANTLTLSNAADLFSGVISGTGGLTIGAGGEILTGLNTYTGTTLIDPGATLQLGNGAGLGVVAGPTTDNGLLVFNGGAASNTIYAKVITGSGAVTVASGTLGLTATNTYTGVTGVDSGATLQLGEGGTTGTVAGAVVDNGLVRFDYSGSVTTPNSFSGTGSAEVAAGTVIVTAGSALGGTVTIDTGATLQWGDGAAGFLVGGGNAVVDNGALVMDFGGGSVGGSIPISGTGTVEVKSGEFGDGGASTYTGVTTIDAAGTLALTGTGSIVDSANLVDNGKFDISGTTAGASIISLSGSGAVSLGAQTLTLTNASGTFSGVLADGGLSGGTGGGLTIAAGTEALTGNSTFTGLTSVNGGATLNLGAGGAAGSVVGPVLDNGTLNLDRNNTLTFAQSISGAGALNQIGTGTTVLDAVNPFTGLTTVSAGALEVGDAAHAGATLGGNVMVGAGGTLMGHGTIAGSVTNFGVVAPGGTIGTLTVGSYTQAVGGTLAIEVSPTAASLLNAMGAANLAGKLALTFDPGTYSAAHIYQIVTGHPVTGTFSATGVTGSPSGEAFGVVYQPTQVDLVTEATANAEVYGAVSAATLDRAQNFATLVEDRFGDATCPDGSTDKSAPGCQGFGAWAFAIGSWSNQSDNAAAVGFHNDGAGVVGGIDRSWENGSLVGAAFGYVHNDLDMTAGGAKASGPSYYGAIYGRLVAEGGLWFDGQAFYMHSDWSVSRTMLGFGVASASPNADSEGFLLQASAPIGDTALRPYGRITYVFSNRGGAMEQGAGPLGFQINSASQSAAVGEVGLQYAPTFTTGGGIVLRPALEFGVQENGGDRSQVISGNLGGLPGSAFNEAGPRLWGVAGVVGGSLKVRLNQSVELFGEVRGRFGDHQTDGVASIGGVFRF